MDEESILKLPRDQCIEKWKEIGQHSPGTCKFVANLNEKIKQENLIDEAHIHSVLINSSVGRSSSVGLDLDYKFTLRAAESLADHDYCRETLFDANVTNIDPEKYLNISRIIEAKYNNSEPSSSANLDFESRN